MTHLLLAVLSVSFAAGFARERLWEQSPFWYPEGWRRLAIFAAIYAGPGVAILWKRPARFELAVSGALIAYSAIGWGIAPVAAVALFLAASFAVGRLLGARDTETAILVGVGAYMFAAYGLMHAPVNYWFVWLVLLAVPAWWERRAVAEAAREIEFSGPAGLRFAVAFVAALHWIVAANPEVSSDGLAMHLAIPAEVAWRHFWPFDAARVSWAVMPMGGDWCYTIVYLLGGEYAARLLNLAMMFVTASLLYRAAGRSWWPVLLYLSSPLAHLVTGNLFVETLWGALAFGAMIGFWRFVDSGERLHLSHAAWMLGCAGMVKLGALVFVVALFPLLARGGWIAAAICVIPACVPYVTAWWITGNPVFPFTGGSAGAVPGFEYPYDLVFRTSRWLESQNGAFGFQYWLLLPLGLVVARGRKEWSLIGVAAAFTLLISRGQANARYLFPVLAFASLVIAPVLERVRGARAVAVVCVALNLVFLPMSSHSNKGFAAADRAEFLRVGAPARELVAWLNEHRAGLPVLFVGNPQIAGLRADAYTDSWHHAALLDKLSKARSAREAWQVLAAARIRLVVAPVRGSGRFADLVALQSLLDQDAKELAHNGAYFVAELAGEPPDSRRGSEPLPRGSHDDSDPRIEYEGAWRRDTQFAEAAGRTLTYDNEPGAAARFTFEGSAFTWIHTRAPNRGRASVWIDGQPRGEFGLNTPAVEWQAKLRFEATPGRHTAEIRILDHYADIDAIIVQ